MKRVFTKPTMRYQRIAMLLLLIATATLTMSSACSRDDDELTTTTTRNSYQNNQNEEENEGNDGADQNQNGGDNGDTQNGDNNGGNQNGNENGGNQNSGDNGGNLNNDFHWVDLGLPSGLLWASHNIGASSLEDPGSYFAWGEVTAKNTFSWDNYIFCNGFTPGIGTTSLTKYCLSSEYGYNGYKDNLLTLQPSDDAATVILGNGARIPTPAEWEELLNINNIHGYDWGGVNSIKINGVKCGYVLGPNGDTLILPVYMENFSYGYYWTNTVCSGSTYAQIAKFSFGSHPVLEGTPRYRGVPIRAVRSAR